MPNGGHHDTKVTDRAACLAVNVAAKANYRELSPPGFSVSATASDTIKLSLTSPVPDANTYDIQRSMDKVSWTTVDTNVTADQLAEYLDGARAAETQYFYRMRSVNAYGTSAWTAVKSDITPAEEVASGTVYHGDIASITGSGFGTHALDTEFTGGASGPVEGATDGASAGATSWDFSGSNSSIKVFNDTKRGKVWQAADPKLEGTPWNGHLEFDYGKGIVPGSLIYLSWYSRAEVLHPDLHSFQWKMFRLEPTDNYVDGGPEIVFFNWINSTGKMTVVRPDVSPGSSNAVSHYGPGGIYPKNDNQWARLEVIIKLSDKGVSNGSITKTLYRDDAEPVTEVISNSMTNNIDTLHRWFMFQNYIGNMKDINGTNLDPMDSIAIGMDDIYIQLGTDRRVELTDSSDLALATKREIQRPVTWADDSVGFEVNQGGLPPGTYYAHVVEGSSTSLGYKQFNVG